MSKLAARIYRGVGWRKERSTITRKARRLGLLAHRLGFPAWSEEAEVSKSPPVARMSRLDGLRLGSSKIVGASVCTANHLHFARALAASFRKHHPQADLVILVVDASAEDSLEVEGATVIPGREIGFPRNPYKALALSASELCCSAKPRLLEFLFEQGSYEKIVYLDSDIFLFSPLEGMISALDSFDFVVTPHMMTPLPHADRWWESPKIGDIAAAGVLNAGMFGLRTSPAAERFIATWRDLVESTDAFLGAQTEQHSFNWLPCFSDSFHVLRDPAYNVAYWNLHERSLRLVESSVRGEGGEFTINGQPLVTFHFSGFDPSHPSRISRWDGRHTVYHHGALARLLETYSSQLASADYDDTSRKRYGFGRFPSGIEIDSRMRDIFKRYQRVLEKDLDPFSEEGERSYCRALLSPAPSSGSFVPILIQELLNTRSDLRPLAPRAEIDPMPIIRWFSAHGALEYGYSELFDAHRPVIPSGKGLAELEEISRVRPGLFSGGIEKPLGTGRSRFLSSYFDDPISASIRELKYERFAISPLWLVRELTEEMSDLKQAYPDLLFSNADEFSTWLEVFGVTGSFVPQAACRAFRRTCKGQSLARIYALMARHWPMMERFPLALVGYEREQFAVELLRHCGRSPELDIDDVVMYLWLMELRPSCGLGLTFSLPYNATRFSLRTNWQDQEELLAPLLGDPEMVRAAHENRRHQALATASPGPQVRRRWHAVEGAGGERFQRSRRTDRRVTGINLFGYFKSPIGLGYMSQGLEAAFAHGGIATARNVLPHAHMDESIFPEDFLGGFDSRMSHNVFVSFPHSEESLLRSRSEEMIRGKQNIAYLAWEQSEAHHLWKVAFEGFDQIWALSDFAAVALEKSLEREVVAVPCVLDTDTFPAAVSKSEVGLEEDRFTVLFVFDPGSSVERKNPLAVVEAFAKAFHPRDKAQLVIRLANYRSSEHRGVTEQMTRLAAKSGLDLKLLTAPMDRSGILRLISAVDCYLSLHRAEGFGFTCAEAMAYGKPTIATGYSGNLTFMDESSSFLVDYEETEVLIPDGPFRRGSPWAEPSVEHAASHLRALFENRRLGSRVGNAARSRVRDLLGKERVARIVSEALGESSGQRRNLRALAGVSEG